MSLMTRCAIVGRMVIGKLLPPAADRRRVAAGNYAVQLLAASLPMIAGTQYLPLTLLGVVLPGLGIGNSTSSPPLVAQVEFSTADSLCVVASILAVSQAFFAFAPATFAVVLQTGHDASTGLTDTTGSFAAVALVQALAAGRMLLGRRPLH